MACNCFDDVLTKATEQVVDKYDPETVVGGSVESNWEGGVFNFTAGDFAPVVLNVNVGLRLKKKSGEPRANMTRNQLGVSMKYCPMCGTEFTGPADQG